MTSVKMPVSIFGVLPAAGMSKRMGRSKQALPYRDSTMAACVARTMLAADLTAVAVVTRTELLAKIDLPRDDRLIVAINDDPTSQMMDSIRLGIARLGEAFELSPDAGVLVTPADMPNIPAAAFRRCADTFRGNPTRIVIATCDGKRGHPIIFPAAMRVTLDGLSGGLNELPARCAADVTEVAYNDPAILKDVDTPADYRNLDP